MTATVPPAAVVPSASSPGYISLRSNHGNRVNGNGAGGGSGRSYYNENDPKAAAWLRALIAEGVIAPGDVDERSIAEVKTHELYGYTQHHFFAGIGGWSLALRLAGYPDAEPAWTGSCPCQPFSDAGKQLGEDDPRHLWPQFRRLIAGAGPTIVFGEQVASSLGRVWLAGIRADLEALGYAVGGADLCAAGIGAPHRRQRLYWMAYAERGELRSGRGGHRGEAGPQLENWADADGRSCERDRGDAAKTGATNGTGRLADTADGGRAEHERESRGRCAARSGDAAERCGLGGLADVLGTGLEGHAGNGDHGNEPGRLGENAARSVAASRRPWDSFDRLPCRDGKKRRVEPGTFPLAHGVSNRVGLLRGYGNAIVPQLAAEFVSACLEAVRLGGGGGVLVGRCAPTTEAKCNDPSSPTESA